MKVHRDSIFFILLIVATLLVTVTPASAQAPWESYAAKFVCNREGKDDLVLKGMYKTVVNIHNPHYLQDVTGLPVPVIFFKKVVLSKPQGEPPLPPSCKEQESLDADFALAVDCDNIVTLLKLSGLPWSGDLEGFLILEVPPQPPGENPAPPLDVTAVYTARPRNGIDPDVRLYDVRALDVERVPATEIIGVPNQNPCGVPR